MISSIKKIDMHMHSTVSDGTDTPQEIISKVSAAGIDLFSLTDHDSIKGAAMIRPLIAEGTPAFICGVEFSTRDEFGKYHILGYGYDDVDSPVAALADRTHNMRMKKVRLRLQLLAEKYGFEFPPEEVEALLARLNPGKPHIGNLMEKYGYAPSKEIAIKEFINKLKIKNDYIRPEEAIDAILKSNGVPVLAHPSYGSGGELIVGEEMEERLKRLMDAGIEGVEAYYSGFTPKLQSEILHLAEKYNLYVSAGSDYHGTNKLVELGDNNLACVSEGPAGLHRFLERIEDRITVPSPRG